MLRKRALCAAWITPRSSRRPSRPRERLAERQDRRRLGQAVRLGHRRDVAGAIKAAGGPVVDKRIVELPKAHIKATGKHIVVVKLHPDVTAKFTLNVVGA